MPLDITTGTTTNTTTASLTETTTTATEPPSSSSSSLSAAATSAIEGSTTITHRPTYIDPKLCPSPHIHIRLDPHRHDYHLLDTPSSSSSSSSTSTIYQSSPTSDRTNQLNQELSQLCLAPLNLRHSPILPATSPSNPSPMMLMCDPNVQRELGIISHRLAQNQTLGGPSLFIILPDPKVSGHDNSPKKFYLYFLCEYAMQEQNVDHAFGQHAQLKLHICESTTVGNTSETTLGDVEVEDNDRQQSSCLQGGYHLRNIDAFLQRHAIPMLSLLRALQLNEDQHLSPVSRETEEGLDTLSAYDNLEVTSATLAMQIRLSIRYLATYCYKALQYFQENPCQDQQQLDDYISTFPVLQWSDFVNDQEAIASSRPTTFDGVINHQSEDPLILGSGVLRQVGDKDTNPSWVCQAHFDAIRDAPKVLQLSAFIKAHGGEYHSVDKSCCVCFEVREDAQEFYRLLIDSQHLRKLELSLSWRNDNGNDVTEEDLWELCKVVHKSSLKELTLACGGEWTITPESFKEEEYKLVKAVSFRPLLGIICKSGLISLTIERFEGHIFPDMESIETQGDIDSFSVQHFRESKSIVIPENIPLKRMVLRSWKYYPDFTCLATVVINCPNLIYFESQTVSIESLFFEVQNSMPNLGNISIYNATTSPFDYADLTLWRLDGERPAIRKLQRRCSTRPSVYIQGIVGLENYSVTRYDRLWEAADGIISLINSNIGTLKSIDLACEIDHLADFWNVIIHELIQTEDAAASAALAREDSAGVDMHNKFLVYLRMNDLIGHKLESVCSDRLHQTSLVLESYDSSFLSYMKSLSEVASILCIEREFKDASQLKVLVNDVSMNGLWFHELSWFLSPDILCDPSFVVSLSELINRPEVQKFTIRIDGGQGTLRGGSSEESIRTLLNTWNELTGFSLGWMEYGRWMQEIAVEIEHPFRETIRLPTGAGELTFISEEVITIGAAMPVYECPEKRIGPVIYGISVNTVI